MSTDPDAPLSDLNFRDLGGIAAGRDRRIRRNTLYRCQGPSRLTDDHRSALAALGLRLVCDLRSDRERAHASQDWGSETLVMNLDVSDDFGGTSGLGRKLLERDPTPAGARAAMRASYARMPDALRRHFPAVIEAIEAGRIPLLVHCTAGKDRTGVMVALLLLFAGVSIDAAVEDYLRSASFADAVRARGDVVAGFSARYGVAIDQATVDAVIGVDPTYLMAAIESVEAKWGSVADYFASAGVDGSRAARLRSNLTEPTQG